MKTKIFTIIFLILSVNFLSAQSVSKNVVIPEDSVYIKQLDRYRKIRIYLPPNYYETDKRYPVLYMCDAQNLFDDKTSYVGEWGVDEILDSLYEACEFELIVVGIDHGGMKRIDEYSAWDNKRYGNGEAIEFGDFLANDLKPKIDNEYRTLPDVGNTGILGSSLGGLFAHFLLFEYPNIFGRAGIFSPSYWYSKEVFSFTESKSFNDSLKFLILTEGKKMKRTAKDVKKIENLLEKKGYSDKNMKIIYDENAKHNEAFWRKYFAVTVLFLFQK